MTSKIIDMTQTRHYSNAPITEALVDLRILPMGESGLKTLQGLRPSLEIDYPEYEEIVVAQGQFQQTGSKVTATATQSPSGYRFISANGKQVFQARLDGFTLSQLKPYKNWETLRNEAKRLWELYRQAAQPKSIERIAVRYINRLDLPLEASKTLNFKDYLRTVPEVSNDMLQGVTSYFMQLQIPQNDLNATLLLNEAIIPPSQDDFVSVILDIDLFCTSTFSVDDSIHWNLLDEFRVRKNQIFEACITHKLRELIQ
ncbi:MAG TPA: TIGR04255 family protein [Stenomitos sp.]